MDKQRKILFKNVHLIDVNSAKEHETSILIKGKEILAIGKPSVVICDEVIDCSGLYAVPSFIDMHVHVTFNSMHDGEMSLDNVALNLAQAAHNGVCIVRDVGMSSKLSINAVRKVIPNYPLPEIVFSGSPLCLPNGHGWEYGTFIDYKDLERHMTLHQQAGFKWVKIMNDPENHSLTYLQALVHSAHRHGLKVACHVFREKGIELAVRAGCDTIEHVVPIQSKFLIDDKQYYVPTAYSAWISNQNRYLESIPEQDALYLIEWYKLLKDNLAIAISRGVNVLCGTDGGCCPSSFGDIVSEMLTLNMLGMSAKDVLFAATINSAKCLGCGDKYGSIEEGKYANFFMVKDNPLVDLKALFHKKIIVLFGSIIKNEVNVPWC